MAKFFVDAFSDMFGKELEEKGLLLAPSKIKFGSKTINFKGWKDAKELDDALSGIQNKEYQILHVKQEDWVKFFTPFLEDGEDVVFFTISQKLFTDGGGDLRSAFTQMSESFPERKVVLVDTQTISRSSSDIAMFASTIFRKTGNLEDAINFANSLCGKYVTAIVVDNVNILSQSPIFGKIMKEFSGGLLNVKPIIGIDTDGNFKLIDKVKGFKAAVNKLFSIAQSNGENIADFTFSVLSFNAKEEAEGLYQRFLQIANPNEVDMMPTSLNNAIMIGKFVGITFHGKSS